MKLLQLIAFSSFIFFNTVYAATFVVDNLLDTDNGLAYTLSDGNNSLRKCIRLANAAAGADIINFAAGGTGTITLGLALPQITDKITIDGTTATGWTAGNPKVDINANGGAFSVLELSGAGSANSIINALILRNSTAWGMFIGNSTSGNTVKGCFIGVTSAGTVASALTYSGIEINNSINNTIGGTGGASDRNVICAAKQDGIKIVTTSTGNTVLGNYIGLGSDGSTILGNGTTAAYSYAGVHVYNACNNTTIGGTAAGSANVISGNLEWGIWINTATNATITGNTVGLNAAGTAAKANALHGVMLAQTSTGCTVGGTTAAARNIISGNGQHGMRIEVTSTGNTVAGNYIGTDVNGTTAIPNGYAGVSVDNSNNNTIGGSTSASRNIISGNTQYGIWLNNSSSTCLIQYNYIGVDVNGNTALPNGRVALATVNDGIYINSNCATTSILNNVISGNGTPSGTLPSPYGADTFFGKGNGIYINGTSSGTIIRANNIGIGANGTTAVRNQENGIALYNGSANTIIGGSLASQSNVIVKHPFHGIVIYQCEGTNIKGNYIGTDAGGTLSLGNQDSQIITIELNSVTIGGTGATDGNTCVNAVENPDGYGIRLQETNNAVVQGNFVGTNSGGTLRMPNAIHGVWVQNFAGAYTCSSNVIGASATAPAAGEANTIAFNTSAGVQVESTGSATRYNRIRGNKIYCNGALGINITGTTNESIAIPTCSSTNNVASGTCAGTNVIHVYKNTTNGVGCGCEGETYVGTTTCAAGAWSLTHNLNLSATDQKAVTATQTNGNSSTSAFSTCTTALPVELLYFNGKNIRDKHTLLEWCTASELNNDYFEILKSTDGVAWTKIGTVSGAGNSSTTLQYSFIDELPSDGTNYYMLKQVDYDGANKSIRPIAVKFKHTGISIFPNPASEIINIRLPYKHKDIPVKHELRIQISDQLGRIVFETQTVSDRKIASIPIPSFSEGIYFVSVIYENQNYLEKLSLVPFP